jgi:hypothetical protein
LRVVPAAATQQQQQQQQQQRPAAGVGLGRQRNTVGGTFTLASVLSATASLPSSSFSFFIMLGLRRL